MACSLVRNCLLRKFRIKFSFIQSVLFSSQVNCVSFLRKKKKKTKPRYII